MNKKKIKDREITIPGEYWIKTSVEDVKNTLKYLRETGEICIEDIPAFMKINLKGKKGGSIAASFRTEKSVKKRKFP